MAAHAFAAIADESMLTSATSRLTYNSASPSSRADAVSALGWVAKTGFAADEDAGYDATG